MNNKLLIMISIILILGFATVELANAETNSCNPEIKIINQYPNPAIPDGYVKVIFEVTNLGNCMSGYSVRLNLEYPFSLDSNSSAVFTIEGSPYAADYRNTWMIPYQIRVDGNALEGDYSLKLDYHEGSDKSFINYAEEEFNITIQDSRTEFDAVIQETSGSEVSIAIANAGKYTANSVVVRIPEQDSFRVTGTDGQMVGSLDSGDYTIVGFSVSPKGTFSRNSTRTNPSTNQPMQSSNNLKFDIYYTDNLGERRIVNMELPLNMGTGNSTTFGGVNFAGRRTTQNNSPWYSSWVLWIIILVILVILYILYKKYPKQSKEFLNKIKAKIKRTSKKEETIVRNINNIPDWIKNAKKKEKSK